VSSAGLRTVSRDTTRLVGDLAYAVTFLFIGQVWVNHHVMYDHIRAADRVAAFNVYYRLPIRGESPRRRIRRKSP